MANLKHTLKTNLREVYARVLFHTGLHAVVDRLMPRRMTILFGHCVDQAECNGFLPADMKIRADNLDRVLGWFGKRYSLDSIAGGHDKLAAGSDGKSVVALSFDDGYRDNRTALLPILQRHGASATIFLESRPLDEGVVNWSHKYHWVIAQPAAGDAPTEMFVRRYLTLSEDEAALEGLRRALEEDAGEDRLRYQAKRVMKYEADPVDRDRVIDQIFAGAGGDQAALCASLYMSWDDARALAAAGIELGGHTVNHVILSRLDREGARAEIDGCRASLARELGGGGTRTFAYPFGRRWDYNDETSAVTREVGFDLAVNTHAGTNGPGTDRMQLRRLPVDDTTPMHLLVAEACGGFDLLRRFGVDLSE
ncbi:polysaccharide deacetylase family protein [Engelhardtia mirabilis]|uniref:Polysaccharide deacetylase n=1 Tax=Engelhardtia mirabilis TaxID=2528011 RepID=A0A518BK94_9BACT|nr:Polysaccharide deacetylase [Planctomycetes bacterium Pla133]QDV01714.1 Polysaccharide deacetylase [Planctomycetes bacterium Pla86]